jgi:hypothetical protein
MIAAASGFHGSGASLGAKIRLWAVGRRDEALTATDHAVEIYRRLLSFCARQSRSKIVFVRADVSLRSGSLTYRGPSTIPAQKSARLTRTVIGN